MRIGIFGGSFNPPHVAHLIVAETVREQFALDRVLWIPNRQPPHKPEASLVAAAHRLAMVRLAVAGNPAFEVSEVELWRTGVSYTVDTVAALQAERPGDTFFLLIGGDSLRDFPSWYRPGEIVRRVPLLVYRRPDAAADVPADVPADVLAALAGRVQFAEAPLLEVSGTEIRARRRAGRSIRYLVPEPVRAYIEANGLYGS
jgi:nicotinate-nucleotide adenylyltransferase